MDWSVVLLNSKEIAIDCTKQRSVNGDYVFVIF